MIDRLEHRTHGAGSAIDDDLPEAEPVAQAEALICHVCDELVPEPRPRACGNRDCPHALRRAA